jgi:hypothetical protein
MKEKLLELKEWFPSILETVKKDLKNEHLKKDYVFVKKYLGGKNIHKLENQELETAYFTALQGEEKGEEIAEFMVHRWIFRNSEMYHFFEKELMKVRPDFTEIKELSAQEGEPILQEALREFGAVKTYIFSKMNGVAFTQDQFAKLGELAANEKQNVKDQEEKDSGAASLEEMQTRHEQELNRLKDKYEKKLLGMQKKYSQDMETLKKQLGNLQRKMAGV